MNRLVLEELKVGRQDAVLEVGFGGGGLLARLVEATDGQIVGVDASPVMVTRARRRFRRQDRVELHIGLAESLPVADASIDKACTVNSLYFWRDPATAMRELARVLRPGGLLTIAFEPPEELRKWPGHRHGFRLYEEGEVRALMEAAGFVDFRCAEGRGRRPDRFLCLTGVRSAPEAAP